MAPSPSSASGFNAPSPGAAVVQETKRHFMPHISFFGTMDNSLGISQFWTEKLFAFILFAQRYAMMLMWNVRWPQLYRQYTHFYYAFLLDFSAHPDGQNSLGQGSMLQGCESACRLVWPLVCIPILFLWGGIAMFVSTPLYYTRNIERMLWMTVRVGLLPFCSMLVRYYILNQEGNLDVLYNTWVTPTSELGVVFLVTTVGLFVYLGLSRSQRQVLFRSSVRHEAYLKTRELEYRLRLSATYRNERIWMISSYVYDAWFWSVARGVVDIVMLLIISFVPPQTGVVLGDAILFIYFAYGFFFDIYRCASTNWMEHVYNCTLFVYCVLATIQAYNITSTWLVDTQIDYFLTFFAPAAVGVTVIMAIYFFVDSHRVLGLTVAERRANEKWRRIFGTTGGGYVKLDKVQLKTLSEKDLNDSSLRQSDSLSGASFHRRSSKDLSSESKYGISNSTNLHHSNNNEGGGDSDALNESSSMTFSSHSLRHRRPKKYTVAVKRSNEGDDSFYLPKSGGFMSVDSSSAHLWPVHDGIINELLRLNQENHLVDMLRAGRAMLDRISALHNTAILIPLDELKTHIFRLQQCVEFCKRYRVTHHCNLIHPLQSVFEDLIEQITYELRVFSTISITVGHNAKKMVAVSRELRIKQVQRDHALALVSPLMRRILVKLLALRLFMQLLVKEDRRTLLGRPINDEEQSEAVDDFGPVRKRKFLPGEEMVGDGSSSSDNDDERRQHEEALLASMKATKKPSGFGGGGGRGAAGAADDPFAEAEELDPFADRPDENPNADDDLGGSTTLRNPFGDMNEHALEDTEEHDRQFAALLAQEARKLIAKK